MPSSIFTTYGHVLATGVLLARRAFIAATTQAQSAAMVACLRVRQIVCAGTVDQAMKIVVKPSGLSLVFLRKIVSAVRICIGEKKAGGRIRPPIPCEPSQSPVRICWRQGFA